MFDTYYELDYNAQSHYLHKLIEEVPVKRSRVKDGVSRRQHTREFSVNVNNEKVIVCQKAFLSIHGINEGRIRLLLKKVAASSGVLTPDKRGKHEPSNKTSQEAKDFVHAFIKKLRTVSSHYSRNKSPNRVYLPPGSNITLLYKLYCEKIKDSGKEHLKVSDFMFRQIFKDYNIGFEPPKSDTCNVCDVFDIKLAELQQANNEEGIRTLKLSHLPHKAHAKIARDFFDFFMIRLMYTLFTERMIKILSNFFYFKLGVS